MARTKASKAVLYRSTTPVKQAQGKARASRGASKPRMAPPKLPDFYRVFFEESPVGFCLCLTNGDFIKVNQAFEDLIGAP